MSTESYEDALKKLGELLTKKSDLGNIAAAKIKQLTSELEELDSSKIDSVERIKSGFNHFKTHNYEKNPSLCTCQEPEPQVSGVCLCGFSSLPISHLEFSTWGSFYF